VIVTDAAVGTGGALLDAGGGVTSWVCLARRGMLHSECDAVDHLRLEPGTRLADGGRSAIGEAWFVVRGAGVLDDGRRLRERDLFVHGPGRVPVLTALTGLELIIISVLPDAVARQLPTRTPCMRETPSADTVPC
jgi:hypothetical protein